MSDIRTRVRRASPITFMRGLRLYQIAPAVPGSDGYLGFCYGRILVRGGEKATVARALITSGNRRQRVFKAHRP